MIRSLALHRDVWEQNTEFKLMRNQTIEALETSVERGDLLWIDVVDPTEREVRWLEKVLTLNPVVVNDLLREDRRPALLVYPRYLFLSLFQPAMQIGRVTGKEAHCLIAEHIFVTVRPDSSTAIQDAYDRAAQNPDAWSRGVEYFLYLAAQHVIDSYYPILDRISNQLNDLEERLLNSETDQTARKPVYRVRQQLINMRQMVAPQREVFSNMIGEQRLSNNEDTRDLFRHLYERLLRIYDVIDAQRDLTGNVLDMLQNQEARKMGEAVNRLTIFSMIFLPLTFLTGLFELNFATTVNQVVLPFSGGTMLMMVVGLMIGSVTGMALLFRRKGWI